MHYRTDLVLGDQSAYQGVIAGIALDEVSIFGDGGALPRGKVVEHDDALAAIEQRMGHMAADIACTASDENGHDDRRAPGRGGCAAEHAASGPFNSGRMKSAVNSSLSRDGTRASVASARCLAAKNFTPY